MLNKLSLKMRLTILTGCIIIAIAMCLTATSIYNIDNKFSYPQLNKNAIFSSEIIPNNISREKDNSQLGVTVQISEAKKQFKVSILIWMIGIIIVGIGATYTIVSRALKPLNNLSNTIKNINEYNLSQPIENFSTKDEIGSLATSFNKMLSRLDKSFSNQKRFAANAAHELKTPLAIIKSGIQVLKLDENPSIDDYKENINITEQSTQRLIQVVDDLLKLTYNEIKEFDDIISVNKIFQDIIKELDETISSKNIHIHLSDFNIDVLGNKPLVYRAFFNILENAVKYNKQGGSIEVSTELCNDMAVISISDTGIGIPHDEIENIFDPFYRVDKSRSREISGSGLGLSIVKTVIEKHRGTINVTSNKDVGTTVNVLLPYYIYDLPKQF